MVKTDPSETITDLLNDLLGYGKGDDEKVSLSVGGNKTFTPGRHMPGESVFEEGDVIVEADGRPGFVTKSKVFKDLYVAAPTSDPLVLTSVEFDELIFPVTVVARNGDPTVNIVVKRKKSGKFKVVK